MSSRNQFEIVPERVLVQHSRPAFYLPQLDGLRFIAFFLVFLHHNLPTGAKVSQQFGSAFEHALATVRDTAGFGLSLFFFLSSYLIVSLLILEREASGAVNLRSFYVRRVLRIWPLYFVFLIGVAIAGWWLPAEHISVMRFAAMSLLAGNWYFIAKGMSPGIIGPLWSISVEEQFYAIWPSVFRRTSNEVFLYFSIAIGVLSLVATAILASHRVDSLNIWMNSLSEFVFFAGGSMAALLLPRQLMSSKIKGTLLTLAGLGLWFVNELLLHGNDRTLQPIPLHASLGYFLSAIGCALVLSGFLYLPQSLIPSWLRYLGKISYGLYVFHGLAMHLVRSTPIRWHLRTPGVQFIVILGITTVLAALSYRVLESPFLRLKRRFELILTRAT